MNSNLASFAVAATLAITLADQPLAAGELDFDVIFGDNPFGKSPTQLTWAPNGTQLSYLWDDGDGEALWVLDVTNGERTAYLGSEDLSIENHLWNPAAAEILVVSDDRAQILRLDDHDTQKLTDDGHEEDPKFSPDGTRIAFVRDHDLYLLDRTRGEAQRLTDDGQESEILNGETDWIYWEELWNRDSTGFWWSPDGGSIAFYRFDETPVPSYPLVNYLTTYPEVEWQRYPKAGQPLPRVQIGVVELATSETRWLETAPPEDHYFPRVTWSTDSQRLIVSQLNRDQNQLDLLSCTAATGACETLMSESWPTWVNLHDDFRWFADGGFLWSSEQSGFRALYLHRADGSRERRLSPEGLTVGGVLGFNADAGWVVYDAFLTAELGAINRGIYLQQLADDEPRELAPPSASHRALVSDASGHWVHRWSDADTPQIAAIRDITGMEIGELPQLEPSGYDPTALAGWEFITIPGPDDTRLPAAILLPSEFDASRRYPVIMYHYGCPASQVVNNSWGRRGRGLWHKMMAERGYIVFMVDNQASTFFGKKGEDLAYRSFGPGNVKAQLAGVDYLETLPYVDSDRIGLWGWSGGGYNTLYALTHAPGTWAAGVAGAPVADWKFYDAIWTERYMDRPEDNPDGYATASALDAADQLEDHLLIVHGTADDNVHPQNTLAMSARLIAAGKRFEQAIYPRQKHGFKGQDSRHFYERMTRFFEQHLAPAEPVAEPEVARPQPRGAAK